MALVQAKTRVAQRARAGFTLVELLIVMTILVVIVSLSAGTYMQVIKTQRNQNTDALIAKLTSAVEQQKNAFIAQVKREQLPSSYVTAANVNGDIAQAWEKYINDRLTQEFPTNFYAAWTYGNPTPTSSLPMNYKYQRILIAANYPQQPPVLPSSATPPTPDVIMNPSYSGWDNQTSACLYMILTQTRGGISFDPDAGLEAGSVVIRSDGMKQIVDAWGHPLVFYSVSAPNGQSWVNPGTVWIYSTRGQQIWP